MRSCFLFFCLLSLLCVPAFAHDNEPQFKKFYCDADQVKVTNSTIIVDFEDGVFEIDNLQVDQGGVYFTPDNLRCINCRKTLNPKNTCECPKQNF